MVLAGFGLNLDDSAAIYGMLSMAISGDLFTVKKDGGFSATAIHNSGSSVLEAGPLEMDRAEGESNFD
jgi:hypothetical protein